MKKNKIFLVILLLISIIPNIIISFADNIENNFNINYNIVKNDGQTKLEFLLNDDTSFNEDGTKDNNIIDFYEINTQTKVNDLNIILDNKDSYNFIINYKNNKDNTLNTYNLIIDNSINNENKKSEITINTNEIKVNNEQKSNNYSLEPTPFTIENFDFYETLDEVIIKKIKVKNPVIQGRFNTKQVCIDTTSRFIFENVESVKFLEPVKLIKNSWGGSLAKGYLGEILDLTNLIIEEDTLYYTDLFKEASENLKKVIIPNFNVTSMSGWFRDGLFSEITISGINPEQITDISSLFYNCKNLTVYNFENFQAKNTTNFVSTFAGCSSLERIDLTNWDLTNVTHIESMFSKCSNLKEIIFGKINTSKVRSFNSLFANCSQLTTLDLLDFSFEKAKTMELMFYECRNLEEIKYLEFNTQNVRSMKSLFNGCSKLKGIQLNDFNTQNLEDMSFMFHGCTQVTEITFENFYFEKLTTMKNAFSSTSITSLDLSVLNNLPNLKSIGSLLAACYDLTDLKLDGFDTSNVENMEIVFYRCQGLKSLDITCLNTQNVKTMENIFGEMRYVEEINIRNLDTRKVTNMTAMFYECNNIESIDLTGIDTSNVTTMNEMFSGCRKLKNIDLTQLETNNVINMSYMFSSCYSLIKIDLTSFVINENLTANKTYSMFDICENLIVITNSQAIIEGNIKLNKPNSGRTRPLNLTFNKANNYFDKVIYTQEEYERINNVDNLRNYAQTILEENWVLEKNRNFSLSDINGDIVEFVGKENVNFVNLQEYKLTFNGNNATSGQMEEQIINKNENTQINKNLFYREGYDFVGWKINNGTKIYQDQEILLLPNEEIKYNVVLYAQWRPKSISIRFDGNGATSGEMSEMFVITDSMIELPNNQFERTGYRFLGWNTNQDQANQGNVEFVNLQQVSFNTDVVLYAVWENEINDKTYSYNATINGYFQGEDVPDSGIIDTDKPLDGIILKAVNDAFSYQGYIDNNWSKVLNTNQLLGDGKNKIEIIKINLKENYAYDYNIYYRVKTKGFGWLDWAKNGENAGSQGYNDYITGIQIKIVSKNAQQPTQLNPSFINTHVRYQGKVEGEDWADWLNGGESLGTEGKGLRLEAMRIELLNTQMFKESANILYQSHVQNVGWEGKDNQGNDDFNKYKKNGEVSGSEQGGLRIEASQIILQGQIANYFDVLYRTQVENTGWLDWAMNNEQSGSARYARRIETIQIQLVPKGLKEQFLIDNPFLGNNKPTGVWQSYIEQQSVWYDTHNSYEGWKGENKDGNTVGSALNPIESMKIYMDPANTYQGDIFYQVKETNGKWSGIKKNNELAGDVGKSNRIEAFSVYVEPGSKLEQNFDVYYRALVDGEWLGYAKNGQVAGYAGKKITAISIMFVPKIIQYEHDKAYKDINGNYVIINKEDIK